MTSWQLYWITRLDSVCVFLFGLFIVGCFCVAGNLIRWLDANCNYKDENKNIKAKYNLKVFTIFIFVIGLLCIWVPSTKEVAAIIIIPKLYNSIATNQKVTQMPDKLLDLANAWIENLKPSTVDNRK